MEGKRWLYIVKALGNHQTQFSLSLYITFNWVIAAGGDFGPATTPGSLIVAQYSSFNHTTWVHSGLQVLDSEALPSLSTAAEVMGTPLGIIFHKHGRS